MVYSFIRAVECYVNDRIPPYIDEDLNQDGCLYKRLSEFEDISEHSQDHIARIEELQNDLALMLDQWTAISIVLNSMQETFHDSTPPSPQATSDIWREMRAASDYLMAQIRKLEKRISSVEEQIKAIQNGSITP